jgi:hypothetical protein
MPAPLEEIPKLTAACWEKKMQEYACLPPLRRYEISRLTALLDEAMFWPKFPEV